MAFLFDVQSLAKQAQAWTGLLREAANAHAEVAAAHEAKLQVEIAAACEKEAIELKKKLEDAERKAKDAAADLQAVTEGKSSTLP
jgi:NADH dehydrogenase/NADH:ubiquinone oxidoreductase subunit G